MDHDIDKLLQLELEAEMSLGGDDYEDPNCDKDNYFITEMNYLRDRLHEAIINHDNTAVASPTSDLDIEWIELLASSHAIESQHSNIDFRTSDDVDKIISSIDFDVQSFMGSQLQITKSFNEEISQPATSYNASIENRSTVTEILARMIEAVERSASIIMIPDFKVSDMPSIVAIPTVADVNLLVDFDENKLFASPQLLSDAIENLNDYYGLRILSDAELGLDMFPSERNCFGDASARIEDSSIINDNEGINVPEAKESRMEKISRIENELRTSRQNASATIIGSLLKGNAARRKVARILEQIKTARKAEEELNRKAAEVRLQEIEWKDIVEEDRISGYLAIEFRLRLKENVLMLWENDASVILRQEPECDTSQSPVSDGDSMFTPAFTANETDNIEPTSNSGKNELRCLVNDQQSVVVKRNGWGGKVKLGVHDTLINELKSPIPEVVRAPELTESYKLSADDVEEDFESYHFQYDSDDDDDNSDRKVLSDLQPSIYTYQDSTTSHFNYPCRFDLGLGVESYSEYWKEIAMEFRNGLDYEIIIEHDNKSCSNIVFERPTSTQIVDGESFISSYSSLEESIRQWIYRDSLSSNNSLKSFSHLESSFLNLGSSKSLCSESQMTSEHNSIENWPADENFIVSDLGIEGRTKDVIELTLSVEGLTDATFLRRFTDLQKLELNVNKLTSLSGCSLLTNLCELSVCDNKLTNIDDIESLTQLRHLNINTNSVIDLSPVSRLTRLCSLSSNMNQITSLSPFSNAYLQKLECSQNKISSIDINAFKSLQSLIYLDLSRNIIEHISGEALSCCHLLQTIILSQNRLSQLPSPLRLPLVKNIWLSGNQIHSLSSWVPLQEYHIFLPMLEKLYLQDNCIVRVDSEVMAVLPSLIELDVSFNQLCSTDSFKGLKCCRRLKILNLKDNPILNSKYSDDLTALEAQLLDYCPGLQILSGNKIEVESRRCALVKSYHYGLQERLLLLRNSWNHRCRWSTSRGRRALSANIQCFFSIFESFSLSSCVLKTRELLIKRNIDKKSGNEEASGQTAKKLEHQFWDLSFLHCYMNQLCQLTSYQLSSVAFCDMRTNWMFKNDWIASANALPLVSSNDSSFESIMSPASIPDFSSFTGIVCMQALWRGRRVRKFMGRLMSSIAYDDEELNEIFLEDDGLSEIRSYIASMPELDSDWLSLVSSSGGAMVYGDHRRRAANRSISSDKPVHDNVSTDSSIGFSRSSLVSDDLGHVGGDAIEAEDGLLSYRSDLDHDEDWNISNPKVLSSLAKRNRRLESFAAARLAKERDKDPVARFAKFAKQANRNSGNTNVSGSFGGKPKTIRSHGNSVSSKRKQAIALPAWMLGEQGDDDTK